MTSMNDARERLERELLPILVEDGYSYLITDLRTVLDALSGKADVDAICDEAVRLTKASEGGRPLWQAAYHGAMLMRAALLERGRK